MDVRNKIREKEMVEKFSVAGNAKPLNEEGMSVVRRIIV